MTNTIDLDKLEQAANKAAESGEWPFYWKAFYDCASPAVVLELIRRLRAAEEDAARYQFLRHANLDDMQAKYWPHRFVPAGEDFDIAIDAAIAAKGTSHD